MITREELREVTGDYFEVLQTGAFAVTLRSKISWVHLPFPKVLISEHLRGKGKNDSTHAKIVSISTRNMVWEVGR